MAKLDKEKPYGDVFGIANHKYEQVSADGRMRYFDDAGNEVDPKTGDEIRSQETPQRK